MSKEIHTPGPWKACTGSHKDSCICGLVWAGGERTVATVAVNRCQVLDHGDCAPPDAESKANARLVAAAPDLLSAVTDAANFIRYALEFFNWAQFPNVHETVEALRDKLKAAIDKAEGGAA